MRLEDSIFELIDYLKLVGYYGTSKAPSQTLGSIDLDSAKRLSGAAYVVQKKKVNLLKFDNPTYRFTDCQLEHILELNRRGIELIESNSSGSKLDDINTELLQPLKEFYTRNASIDAILAGKANDRNGNRIKYNIDSYESLIKAKAIVSLQLGLDRNNSDQVFLKNQIYHLQRRAAITAYEISKKLRYMDIPGEFIWLAKSYVNGKEFLGSFQKNMNYLNRKEHSRYASFLAFMAKVTSHLAEYEETEYEALAPELDLNTMLEKSLNYDIECAKHIEVYDMEAAFRRLFTAAEKSERHYLQYPDSSKEHNVRQMYATIIERFEDVKNEQDEIPAYSETLFTYHRAVSALHRF